MGDENNTWNLAELAPVQQAVDLGGGRIVHISTDVRPVMSSRISHWLQKYAGAIRGEVEITEEDEREADSIAAAILGISIEEAQALGFPAEAQLFAFLVNKLSGLTTVLTRLSMTR